MPTDSPPFPKPASHQTSVAVDPNIGSGSGLADGAMGARDDLPFGPVNHDADRNSDRAMPSAAGLERGAGRSQLLERVVAGAHATIDHLADSAAPHVNRLTESLHGTGNRVHDSAGQLRESGGEWAESLRSTVREHPLAALGAALAVGLLVAKLWR